MMYEKEQNQGDNPHKKVVLNKVFREEDKSPRNEKLVHSQWQCQIHTTWTKDPTQFKHWHLRLETAQGIVF